jgi:hypothetical protein
MYCLNRETPKYQKKENTQFLMKDLLMLIVLINSNKTSLWFYTEFFTIKVYVVHIFMEKYGQILHFRFSCWNIELIFVM